MTVLAEGKTLTASTTIPFHVPIDFLYLIDAPGEPNDTLRQMRGLLTDSAGITNYYRNFTGVNGESLIAGFSSVFNDAFLMDSSDLNLYCLEPKR